MQRPCPGPVLKPIFVAEEKSTQSAKLTWRAVQDISNAALLGPREVFSDVYVVAEYPTFFFGQALLNKPRFPHVQTSRRVTCNILETPGHFMKWRSYASLDVSSIGLSNTWVVMSPEGPIVVLGHLEHKT